MNKKQEIIRKHLTCVCDEAYKSRKLTDPNCFLCEYESEIELMMEEYAQEQLKNCNKQSVSQRSEQLLDFVNWYNEQENSKYIPNSAIGRFYLANYSA